MKPNNMLIFLSFFLILLGGYLQFHLRTQIGNKTNKHLIPKTDIIRELNRLIPEIRNLKDNWRNVLDGNRSKRDKAELKYSKSPDLQQKIDSIEQKGYISHQNQLRIYNENYKTDAKRVKYDAESYLNIYRKSEVSYAEYDRIKIDLDLNKVINDLELLKGKLESMRN